MGSERARSQEWIQMAQSLGCARQGTKDLTHIDSFNPDHNFMGEMTSSSPFHR